MRGAIGYLVLTRLKNQLKSFKAHPSRLIYVLLMLGLLGVTFFSARTPEAGATREASELALLVGAFYGMMFLMLVNSGFKNGASFFSLSDVNLLFPAPIRPRSVLFYGLFRQLGASLLLGFFLLFQYGWLKGAYGVGIPALILILVCYAVTIFSAQVVAMLCYSWTSADEKRRVRLKSAVFGLFFVLAGLVVLRAVAREGFSLQALVESADSPLFRLIPVAGWMSGVVLGAVAGDGGMAAFYAALAILFLIGMVVAIVRGNHDFYEDVLRTAEVSHNAITAKKEGRVEDSAPANVKIGKTGLKRGWGASALYFKHRLENRRASRFLLPPVSLIYAAVVFAFALFMREAGPIAAFAMAVYMQIFSEALSRFNRELIKPFIYLMPDKAFSKLFQALRETLFSGLLESALIFVPVGLVLHCAVWEIAALVFARWTFTLVFAAANVSEMRVFGGVTSKFLMVFFYIAIAIVIALPGGAAAIVMGAFGQPMALCLAVLGAMNIPMALLVLFLCRNMLQYAELNNV